MEVLADREGFTVTAFVIASGHPVTYPDRLHDHDLYYPCGQAIGRLHAASVSYVPTSPRVRRADWHDNFYLRHIRDFVPHDDPVFCRVDRGHASWAFRFLVEING